MLHDHVKNGLENQYISDHQLSIIDHKLIGEEKFLKETLQL